MSVVVSAPVVWSSEKVVSLPRPKRHRHNPSPVSPGFVAPSPGLRLSFGPTALAGAIARTATTREDAPIEMVERKERNALSDLEYYILDGQAFELSPNIEYLIDTERTHFAGQVGSGIAHLYMESLGYSWRANAECLTRRSWSGPRRSARFDVDTGDPRKNRSRVRGEVPSTGKTLGWGNITARIGRPWILDRLRLPTGYGRRAGRPGRDPHQQAPPEAGRSSAGRVPRAGRGGAYVHSPHDSSVELPADGGSDRCQMDRLGPRSG